MRAFAAVVTAVAVCAAAPAFADAQSHVQAAKKAERKGEWRKALEEWKAAYSSDVNAEYLIGIGDAYAHIGNKSEAKKNYQAYLADPLALPSNVEKVKQKIAELDNPSAALALPGGPALALPGAASPPPLSLDSAPSAKKGKKGDASLAPLPGLDLPGLALPSAPPAQTAAKKPEPGPPLTLPGLELPGTTPAPTKKEPTAVASKDNASGKQVAATSPSPKQPVPLAVTSPKPLPASQAQASSGGGKVLAYVAAGAAVVGLGVGVFGFTQASSAHSDLTGKVHDGA